MNNGAITNTFLPAIGELLIIALVAASFVWFFVRSKTLLQKWAAENGFQITHYERKWLFFTGPFKWWTTSRNQTVYFVRVRDRDGYERSGWVRCGSFFGGVLFSDKTEVRWDET